LGTHIPYNIRYDGPIDVCVFRIWQKSSIQERQPVNYLVPSERLSDDSFFDDSVNNTSPTQMKNGSDFVTKQMCDNNAVDLVFDMLSVDMVFILAIFCLHFESEIATYFLAWQCV
jgi:hypothetical protein